ncbi:MAG: sigma-70 family RNA polymerase sigma factor [Planctomycetota bacterium]|nr:MAG: sigma-70 family RNA polymerase sigma factor [Planctomycetota bacterium]
MARAHSIALPPELNYLLSELTSAEVADNQKWILNLMLKQGPIVLSALWRMLGSEQDVMDAYQTAVCRLTERGKNSIGSNRGGYFYKTAINAGIEIIRRRKQRREQWPAVVEAQRNRDTKRAELQTGEKVFDQKEIMEQTREAIAHLPPHLRNVIILRDLTELPYLQVARIMGITVGTARLYRRQAIIRLADLIAREVNR